MCLWYYMAMTIWRYDDGGSQPRQEESKRPSGRLYDIGTHIRFIHVQADDEAALALQLNIM